MFGCGAFLALSVAFLLSWINPVYPYQVQDKSEAGSLQSELGAEFTSKSATVNGTSIHYVRGGQGPALILIHGFPQDWFEYRRIMPRLAKQFTVIAVDLRGIGGSTATSSGYDAANMAKDVHQLAATLGLDHVYVVGHDIGAMVAYAFVRRYPEATRGAMMLDGGIPGIKGWEDVQSDSRFWHIAFMQVPGLAEKLVTGRQADYFAYFFQFGKFTPSDKAHYVRVYSDPAKLHAMFEMYRAFPENAKFNAAQQSTNNVPLFLGAGDQSPVSNLIPKMAEGLRANGCTHVEIGLIRGAVHYVVEDQPEAVADLIERHALMPSQ